MTFQGCMRYWGKARKDENSSDITHHLLFYHSLDVASVADVWWQKSASIRHCLTHISGLNEAQTKAWVLFFVALHDYGKFDVRFQLKVPAIWSEINPELNQLETDLTARNIKDYNHGHVGVYWLFEDFSELFQDDNVLDAWASWLIAVAGHHGAIPDINEYLDEDSYDLPVCCDSKLRNRQQKDRKRWVAFLEAFFLIPNGLSINSPPPLIQFSNRSVNENQYASTFLAGFCSVCDWLGSSEKFEYNDKPMTSLEEINMWFEARKIIAHQVLNTSGILGKVKPSKGVSEFIGGNPPRSVQCLSNQIPVEPSLTIVEAATGSGKTEMALSLAWNLLAEKKAESIVFALPTQATANAMLSRLESAAPIIFEEQSNLVLAHGKAKYNQSFINLKDACNSRSQQGSEEAYVQCAQWLAQSRKRVFLGQIGVCTVDQVLVSVLPIKHKFIRGFGVGRSVLIIDEVHAYDSYMYSLLKAVLKQQKFSGGSTILLSATLPHYQKKELTHAWDCTLEEKSLAYPLVTQCVNNRVELFSLDEPTDNSDDENKLEEDFVNIEINASAELLPDTDLLQKIVEAVTSGAQVCLICNLVSVAQNLYHHIRQNFSKLSESQILLFHSRFVYKDRENKEVCVKNIFGKTPKPKNARDIGHLLIATQVVEQSLDIDFDWMITQLCPVDLLFQRFGRLHRHSSRTRPEGFEKRVCTVLVPSSLNYQLHALIYGNSRVLWRTHQLLLKTQSDNNKISFPKAYRKWIEKVYQEDNWHDEPKEVLESFEKYQQECVGSVHVARDLTRRKYSFEDIDSNVACLTRDGDMGGNVVPYYIDSKEQRRLLDHANIKDLDKSIYWESISLNTVSVPSSWVSEKKLPESDDEGLIWLPLKKLGDTFVGEHKSYCYLYDPNMGLSREEER